MVASRHVGFAVAASCTLLAVLLAPVLTRVTCLHHQAPDGAVQERQEELINVASTAVIEDSATLGLDRDERDAEDGGSNDLEDSEHGRQLQQDDDDDEVDTPRVRKRKRKRAAGAGGASGEAAGGGGGVVSTIGKWLGTSSDLPKGERVLPRMQRPLVRRGGGGGDDLAADAGGEDGGGRLRRKKKKKKKRKGFMGKKKRAMGGGGGDPYGDADGDAVQDLYR